MADKQKARLGAVQETLFIPLAARARATARRKPLLRDPRAVELVDSIEYDAATYDSAAGGPITVLRTLIFDAWVGSFLADNPSGTVVEIGTGLNTRFERVDNGSVHWIDLDLPDTIELRRRFFTDTDRRRTVAASVLDDNWPAAVADCPGPYFFVAEGVLVYLPEDDVTRMLARLASRFPGAMVAFDTYSHRMVVQQHKLADRKGMAARWDWGCDDPRSLTGLGLDIVEAAAVTRPPRAVAARLPAHYRFLLPLANRLLGGFADVTLFRAGPG
jgi:O-methyltransferase involved in polyketide biosynthesis